ncbi:hypothetical protein SARI_01389 [Salmonella enterica subsp. arizonae serovar 62:z4,z23:-]|uniref:Uncharacterized protein n=1 Tax=Salmonella arizonae (strain ATCC BAA-731 / CDC346-86 / RSK2980) TaxID=41514 RepID=A9MQZ2_SALAR|nr:hypothetical protein SARI_01389 [Salmonella enterica subsp. arizonae serovar 62:z4,z23:-]
MRKEKMAAFCRHKNVQILKFRLYLYPSLGGYHLWLMISRVT